MEREELEKLIADKVMKGEMPVGLYDSGIWIVRVYLDDEDGDTVCFEWSDYPTQLSDYISI